MRHQGDFIWSVVENMNLQYRWGFKARDVNLRINKGEH